MFGRPSVDGERRVRAQRRERRAVAGACVALAALSTAFAAAGFLGDALASQLLIANLRIHAAGVAAMFWICAGLAGWPRLAGLGSLAALALIVATLAEVRWTSVRPAAEAAERFRLLSFNMLSTNSAGVEIAQWLIEQGPDIVVTVESLPLRPHLGALAAAYPYRAGCDGAECDVMILSRVPLSDRSLVDVPNSPARIVSARAAISAGGVWIHAAHWSKGFFDGAIQQHWATHRQIRLRRRADGAPFVVAGDFNAAPWDPILMSLAQRLHFRLPLVWAPTWPTALGPFGFQIDHVGVSPELVVERFDRMRDSFGSNHRGVIAELALLTGG